MTTALQGDVWILGMPFLRAYSAVFNRKARTVELGQIELGSDLCTTCGGVPALQDLVAASPPSQPNHRPRQPAIHPPAHARPPPHRADAPAMSAAHARGAAAAVSALLPRSPEATLHRQQARRVKPSVMSFKSLMLPTWAARHSRPVHGSSSQRVLLL